MSGTYLYVVGPKAIEDTREFVASLERSPRLFEEHLTKTWGEIRYSHAAFLKDAKVKQAGSRDVYYLAHTLKDRQDHEKVFMDVELRLLFLSGEWLGPGETGPDGDDAVLTAVFEREASFEARGDSAAFKEGLRDAGLPGAFASDLWLLNKLCNLRETAPPGAATRYPMWILAGWDNYGGHLTAKELRKLDPKRKNGFLSVFRRAVEFGKADEKWQLGLVDRFEQVREKTIALGDDALCIAVSSV